MVHTSEGLRNSKDFIVELIKDSKCFDDHDILKLITQGFKKNNSFVSKKSRDKLIKCFLRLHDF